MEVTSAMAMASSSEASVASTASAAVESRVAAALSVVASMASVVMASSTVCQHLKHLEENAKTEASSLNLALLLSQPKLQCFTPYSNPLYK